MYETPARREEYSILHAGEGRRSWDRQHVYKSSQNEAKWHSRADFQSLISCAYNGFSVSLYILAPDLHNDFANHMVRYYSAI